MLKKRLLASFQQGANPSAFPHVGVEKGDEAGAVGGGLQPKPPPPQQAQQQDPARLAPKPQPAKPQHPSPRLSDLKYPKRANEGDNGEGDEDDGGPHYDDKGNRLYCVCRKPYNPRAFMIGCDVCDDWFHGRCMRITAAAARAMEKYVCPRCKRKNEREKRALVGGEEEARGAKVPRNDKPPDAPSRPGGGKGEDEAKAKDDGAPRPQACQRAECNNPAQAPSSAPRYCGQACALLDARENVRRRQQPPAPSPLAPGGPPRAGGGEAASAQVLERLERLEAERKELAALLARVGQKEARLGRAIERANVGGAGGQCGCPLDEAGDASCQVPAQACTQHANWQSLKADELREERSVHEQALRKVKLEEGLVRSRQRVHSMAS